MIHPDTTESNKTPLIRKVQTLQMSSPLETDSPVKDKLEQLRAHKSEMVTVTWADRYTDRIGSSPQASLVAATERFLSNYNYCSKEMIPLFGVVSSQVQEGMPLVSHLHLLFQLHMCRNKFPNAPKAISSWSVFKRLARAEGLVVYYKQHDGAGGNTVADYVGDHMLEHSGELLLGKGLRTDFSPAADRKRAARKNRNRRKTKRAAEKALSDAEWLGLPKPGARSTA